MDDGSSLALYAKMARKEREEKEMLDSDEDSIFLRNDSEYSDDENFVAKLNTNSDEELIADSDEEVDPRDLLDISDSEDDVELVKEGGTRDEEAIAARHKARMKEKRAKRNTFDKFFMPKLSDLRRKAGLPFRCSNPKSAAESAGASNELINSGTRT